MSTGLFDVLALQGITHPSTNVSSEATVVFEEKLYRNAMRLELLEATFTTQVYVSLALGAGSKVITAAEAKTLPGVVAGEAVTFYGELWASSLAAGRAVRYDLDFYDDTGTQQGSTYSVSASTSGEWQQVTREITVPANATRVNITMAIQAEAGQTLRGWFANMKLVR